MAVNRTEHQKMIKHVGTYNDKRCAIVHQLPEQTDSVHIIDTDALHPKYHQNLMDIIMSDEAQNAKWLSEVLHRRVLFDGTNALQTFYSKNIISVVPVNKVYLTPRPNIKVLMSEVFSAPIDPLANVQNPSSNALSEMEKIAAEEQLKLNEGLNVIVEPTTEPMVAEKFNQHAENLQGDVNEQNARIAANLVMEAEMLEYEAAKKRTLAATYNPSLGKKNKKSK